MIKQNELRIGNSFLDNLGREFKVEGLKDEYVYFSLANGTKMKYKVSTLKPVPLTEEWLINFCFEKIGINFNLIGMSVWMCNDLFFCNKNAIIIKTVHQLQNLYFALTNNELKTK